MSSVDAMILKNQKGKGFTTDADDSKDMTLICKPLMYTKLT